MRHQAPRRRRPLCAKTLALVAGAWARGASAQGDDEAARQALIQEAVAASQAGQHAQAISCARRALSMRATASLHFLLAREELAVSLPLEAHEHATLRLTQARADVAVSDRDALVARCETLQREARGALGELVVRTPVPRLEGIRVFVDGLPVAAAQLDVAVLRLPGALEVRATAPGREPFVARRELPAGASETVVVVLRAQTPAVAPPASPPPRAPPPRPNSYVGPWSLAGTSLAAAVTAGVLGGLALGARADRDALCPSAGVCDVAASTAADARYRDFALGANVGFATFGVLAGAALTWWLVLRFGGASARATSALPSLTLRW